MAYRNQNAEKQRYIDFDERVERCARDNALFGPSSLQVMESGVLKYGYKEKLEYGKQYFVGKQNFTFQEQYEENKTQEFPYGVYRLVGSYAATNIMKDLYHDRLIFEGKNGQRIDIYASSCIMTKEKIIEEQRRYGFFYPLYMKDAWPELEEDRTNMPKWLFEIEEKPDARHYIDAFLSLAFWILGILILKEAKGGMFSFNFWGTVAYYLWCIIGGLFVLNKIFGNNKNK